MTGAVAKDALGNPTLPQSTRKDGAPTCAPARLMTLALLRVYKRWISPAFPPSCRYVPTCSEYAMEAVERHGVVRGGLMAGWRLLRCHPLAKGGLDAVVTPTHSQKARISGAPGARPQP
jgi:putative membrane protein insertion efficiency factor